MSSLLQLIETLPVIKLQYLLQHKFFDAANAKKQEQEIRAWINMNNALGAGSQFDDTEDQEQM